MCGIIGWKNFDETLLPSLIEKNRRRGGYSTGFYFYKENEIFKALDEDLNFEEFISKKIDYTAVQFRVPTVEYIRFKEEENKSECQIDFITKRVEII